MGFIERPIKFLSLVWLLFLAGCISIPNSQNPAYYNLTSVREDQITDKFSIVHDPVIAITTVKIPDYLDRPQIVTTNKDGVLVFAQFHRWAEPLDKSLSRVVEQNLSLMIPASKFSAYYWNLNIPIKYQISLELLYLNADLKNNLDLAVRWMIIDVHDSKIMASKRFEFNQAIKGGTYAALAKTLSDACVLLSKEIAQTLNKTDYAIAAWGKMIKKA